MHNYIVYVYWKKRSSDDSESVTKHNASDIMHVSLRNKISAQILALEN